ncbi:MULTISPECIES: hypothetical protein [Cyanophyceae]|nr:MULTISPECIES: hypothetical protein [unclassified Trichocoleus]
MPQFLSRLEASQKSDRYAAKLLTAVELGRSLLAFQTSKTHLLE